MQEGKELGNIVRNERQKSVLLSELGKATRKQVAQEIETTKQRIAECGRWVKKRK